MHSLNPLIDREWRGRFRRPTSHLFAALWVALMAAIVCFGAWRLGFLPALTPQQWRQNGHRVLDSYWWMGAIVFWSAALLVGAVSVVDERENATWEELLLCRMGGQGLVVGKIASGAAYLLLLQLVLLAPLVVAGLCFGVTPWEIGGVMLSHGLLTVQGVSLGLWGAVRAGNLVEGLFASSLLLLKWLIQGVLIALGLYCGLVILGLLFGFFLPLILPRLLIISIGSEIYAGFIFIIQVLLSLVGGMTGVGVVLYSDSQIGSSLFPLLLVLGQVLGIALILKWSAWQVDYPARDFFGSSPADIGGKRVHNHLRVLYGVWSWSPTPHQVADFPLFERFTESALEAEVNPLVSQLLLKRKRREEGGVPLVEGAVRFPIGEAINRLRIPVASGLIRLNPVLWLDLKRVLSLRVPEHRLWPVLSIGTLVGATYLLFGLLPIVHGWFESAHYGTAGDRVVLHEGWEKVRAVLFFVALASGPLWGAKGYLVERRSEMLLEMRLTLLSAGAVCWGKLVARLIAFVLLSLPLLALAGFFAFYWPEKNGPNETLTGVLSSGAVAVWSLLVCLCISDACRKELMAFLWCAAFAVFWGVLCWQFPAFPWMLSHLVGATLATGYLFWRMKRLGFG